MLSAKARALAGGITVAWTVLFLFNAGAFSTPEQPVRPPPPAQLLLPTDLFIPPRDLEEPGPEPPPPVLSPQHKEDAKKAAILERWEERRLRHVRATYARDKAGFSRCLPDEVLGRDSRGGWRDRLRTSARLPPLTEEVQGFLWDHQHPADCKNTSFLVWRLWNTGLGADIHTLAQALGHALATKRVLLVDTSAVWWYAMDSSPSTLECFFVPPSNCSITDAGEATPLYPKYHMSSKYKKVLPRGAPILPYPQSPRSVRNLYRKAGDISNPWSNVPFPATWGKYGYQWWMGQATRYLLRKLQPWFESAFVGWLNTTFPEGVPAKMVGIHVRHGDKYKEMKLLPLREYMDEAEKLRKEEPDLRDIFLSTEDPKVLEESKDFEDRGWRFHWTKHLRSNSGSPMEYAMLIGPSKLGEISFVNLLIQERYCTHWVGTDKSNWNRLINEMRLTSGSYGSPYVQLNKKKCVGTPQELEVPGWVMGC